MRTSTGPEKVSEQKMWRFGLINKQLILLYALLCCKQCWAPSGVIYWVFCVHVYISQFVHFSRHIFSEKPISRPHLKYNILPRDACMRRILTARYTLWRGVCPSVCLSVCLRVSRQHPAAVTWSNYGSYLVQNLDFLSRAWQFRLSHR